MGQFLDLVVVVCFVRRLQPVGFTDSAFEVMGVESVQEPFVWLTLGQGMPLLGSSDAVRVLPQRMGVPITMGQQGSCVLVWVEVW